MFLAGRTIFARKVCFRVFGKMLNSFTPIKRASSVRIAEEIKEKKASMTVIDPIKSTNFHDTDFDDIIPIGEGDQGRVYAILVKLSDGTEQRMVVKRLARKRPKLMASSLSTNASFASHAKDSMKDGIKDGVRPGPFTEGPRVTHFFKETPSESSRSEGVQSGRSSQQARHGVHHGSNSPFCVFKQISQGDQDLVSNNLINLVHVIEHRGEKFALSAYCGIFLDEFIDGQLKHLFENDLNRYLVVIKKIMLDLLNAILVLNYDKGYVHRDIKPENIAFFDGSWCLTDFEASAKASAKVSELIGARYYMHPSCFVDPKNSVLPANDEYALSLVFRKALFMPELFKSQTVDALIDEKLDVYKQARERKFLPAFSAPVVHNQFNVQSPAPSTLRDQSSFGSLGSSKFNEGVDAGVNAGLVRTPTMPASCAQSQSRATGVGG